MNHPLLFYPFRTAFLADDAFTFSGRHYRFHLNPHLFLLTLIQSDETCRNGLTGVENSAVCCNAGCGICGGYDCHEQAREAALTPDDCCVTNIIASGVYCDDSQSAPCIMGINNSKYLEDTTTCCAGYYIERKKSYRVVVARVIYLGFAQRE